MIGCLGWCVLFGGVFWCVVVWVQFVLLFSFCVSVCFVVVFLVLFEFVLCVVFFMVFLVVVLYCYLWVLVGGLLLVGLMLVIRIQGHMGTGHKTYGHMGI